MPMTMAPVLVDMARALAKDRKALSQVKLQRWTASYKITHGMAKTFHEETIENMKKYAFSLNLDESTSTSNKRVLAVLVSFYSPASEKVVVEHLAALELVKVDTNSIFEALDSLFEQNDIPWSNLTSMLMDSCNVMRGSKAGLEIKVRTEKAKQLLDIDGDSCHHIHNASKKFCKPFDNHLESLFTDLHNDHKWSRDLQDFLAEMCELLDVQFTVPERFVPHRWLSAYDVGHSTKRMFKAFVLFYYGFLPSDMKGTYKDVIIKIQEGLNEEAKGRIRAIHAELGRKRMTPEGRQRKDRIISKVLYEETKTLLILNFYLGVLPVLKNYVMVFQSKAPLIHQLHDRQLDIFTQFLALFVKAEHLVGKSPRELKELKLPSEEEKSSVILGSKDMFIGGETQKIIDDCHAEDITVKEFREHLRSAYLTCGSYMQKKLPLDSPTLKALSCIDPCARGHSITQKGMRKLVTEIGFKHFLTPSGQDAVLREIINYQIDRGLPQYSQGADVVDWWSKVMNTGRYPHLSKIVAAAFSIFHGPQVESSFNVMGDVIDAKTTRLNIQTYGAIQTIKYSLRSKNVTAVEYLKRDDPVYSGVNKRMCRNIRAAAATYNAQKEHKRKAKEARKTKFMLKSKNIPSKVQAKKALEEREKEARLAHEAQQKPEAKKSRKRALEALAEKMAAKKKKFL